MLCFHGKELDRRHELRPLLIRVSIVNGGGQQREQVVKQLPCATSTCRPRPERNEVEDASTTQMLHHFSIYCICEPS